MNNSFSMRFQKKKSLNKNLFFLPSSLYVKISDQ